MFTHHSRPGPHRQPAARKTGTRLARLAAILTAATCGLLASAVAATAAFANPIPVGDGGTIPMAPVPATTVRVVTAGGMAGWQITLIALGTALVAATAAVLADRARAAHRAASATTA
jgi:hypothetical protein